VALRIYNYENDFCYRLPVKKLLPAVAIVIALLSFGFLRAAGGGATAAARGFNKKAVKRIGCRCHYDSPYNYAFHNNTLFLRQGWLAVGAAKMLVGVAFRRCT
jgi:hypothetical protein